MSFVALGVGVQLGATLRTATGNVVPGATLVYTSGDESVVTVDHVGEVVPVGDGQTSVSVYASGLKAEARVSVAQKATGIAVEVTKQAGQVDRFDVRVSVIDANHQPVKAFRDEVRAYLLENSAGATLEGETTVQATGPVVTFEGLRISEPGLGYYLGASAIGLEGHTFARADVPIRFGSISVARFITCGLTLAGHAYCWGRNENGGLGIGSAGGLVSRPTRVATDLTFTVIRAGAGSTQDGWFDGFACGLVEGGKAYCWGHNLKGQLGIGFAGTDEFTPVAVATAERFVDLALKRDQGCGLTADGRVLCWGRNCCNQLGNGRSPEDSYVPVEVAGGRRYRSIASGDESTTCAITIEGETQCWPFTGGDESHRVPTTIPGDIRFAQIEPRGWTLCGVDHDQVGYCWGRNYSGWLGPGDGGVYVTQPQPVPGGHHWREVRPLLEAACGLTTEGVVLCWGDYTLGGNGNLEGKSTLVPAPIASPLRFVALDASGEGACALTEAGEAYCWGNGSEGERGDGDLALAKPQPVLVLTPVVQLLSG